ncbi:MAG: hypothetical protein ABIH23_15935 [bacterium]
MRWLSAACGVVAIVLWAFFMKVSHMADNCPALLVGLRDGLGTMVFAMAALASLVLSLSVADTARKSKTWDAEVNPVFWGGIFLAAVFVVSALQFIVVGRWSAIHPTLYIIIKLLLFIGVIGYLAYALQVSRRDKR